MTPAYAIPPVVRTIRVARTPTDAFRLFTADMGLWWPLATHSIGGATSALVMEPRTGGRLIETAADGATHIWGTVTDFTPGARVAFTWHVGRTADQATHVEVSFTPEGDATIVDLVHTGWEKLPREQSRPMRDGYNSGWVAVFENAFGTHAGLAPVTQS